MTCAGQQSYNGTQINGGPVERTNGGGECNVNMYLNVDPEHLHCTDLAQGFFNVDFFVRAVTNKTIRISVRICKRQDR